MDHLEVPVFEALVTRRPDGVRRLVEAGLLPEGYALERVTVVVELRARRRSTASAALEDIDWEQLMRHDAYRRVRGALRQVGWGS